MSYNVHKQIKMIGVMNLPKYDNFVFYGSWKENLEGLKGLCTDDVVKEVAWQIINLGTTQEMDTDNPNIENIVNGMCRDLIAAAKKRREASVNNGGRGGRPSKYSTEEIVKLHDAGLSNQDIADNLGCSLKTVRRALAEIENDDEI